MDPFLKRPCIFSSLKSCFTFAVFVFSILILFHFIIFTKVIQLCYLGYLLVCGYNPSCGVIIQITLLWVFVGVAETRERFVFLWYM